MITQKTIFLEDSIMRKGYPATVGSKILENFTAPIDAAVVERLTKAGYALESAPPSSEFSCGIRSGLSAVTAVAEGRSDLGLYNDFFGAADDQAAARGLYTIRPTYGTVSRYGLIPSVCSMDTICIACKDIKQGFGLLELIAGHDSRDGVSEPEASYNYAPSQNAPEITALDAEMLPLLAVLPAVMDILISAELSANLSRYDGVKFGYRASDFKGLESLYLKTRTEGFSLDTKLMLVMGSMVLSEGFYEKRYHKAMQVRRMIRDQAERFLEENKVFSVPPSVAPLCGLPSVYLPDWDGTYLVAARKNENALYTAAVRGDYS